MLNWFLNLLSFFIYLIPKKTGRIAFFGANHNKYSDNSKYAFESISKTSSFDVFWISSNTEIVDEINSKGFNCYKKDSLLCAWRYVTSEFVVSGETDIPRYYRLVNRGAKYICVSHGFGPRSVVSCDGVMFKTNNAVREAINAYDFFLFPNKYLGLSLGKLHFDLPDSKVIICPQFRIERFTNRTLNPRRYDLIFAPTWRQSGESVIDLLYGLFESKNLDEVNNVLKVHNQHLTVLSHPLEIASSTKRYTQIEFLSGPLVDATEVISSCKMLISDYSSLITDALSFCVPVAIFAPDLEFYQYQYGLNTYWEEDICEIRVESFEQVMALKNLEYPDLKWYLKKYGNAELVNEKEVLLQLLNRH